jgi:hypothetical protein
VCSKPLLKRIVSAVDPLSVATTIGYGEGTFKKKEGSWGKVEVDHGDRSARRGTKTFHLSPMTKPLLQLSLALRERGGGEGGF